MRASPPGSRRSTARRPPWRRGSSSRAGFDAYRSYSEAGGIADELRATAAANPTITKLVTIGRTVQGKEILALKVTKNAKVDQGRQAPAVLYGGAQHAREWITPEMVRRLMHHFLDGYGTDPEITSLIEHHGAVVPAGRPTPTATTSRSPRATACGARTCATTTATAHHRRRRRRPQPQLRHQVGLGQRGLLDRPGQRDLPRHRPGSEPETQALDALFDRVGFEFYINYHSAAELLLYGIGWQVSTPSPDDVIYEAMAGDDANPAVPGYDPDISAELYTTNGDTDTHATVAHGTLGFTPEMTTCETVSASIPDDEWRARGLRQRLQLPRRRGADPGGVREEHPVRAVRRQSAHDPDDPVSVVGRTAADMVTDPFAVSHGTTQPVAVTAKRALKDLRLKYSVNGGPPVGQDLGLERRRAVRRHPRRLLRASSGATSPAPSRVTRCRSGSPGSSPGRAGEERAFTYKVADDIGGDVLILAAEDVTGSVRRRASPARSTPTTTPPRSPRPATPRTSTTWTSTVGPRPITSACCPTTTPIVWESGDDIITRALGQPGRHRGRARDRPRADRPRLPQRGRQGAGHRQVQPVRPGR